MAPGAAADRSPPALPRPLARRVAPTHWRQLDFLSDLHLHEGDPALFGVWRDWMARTDADAVFILGDLFEVWVGDDHDGPFERACREVLANAAKRRPVHFMRGNRDFLVGPGLLSRCGLSELADPTCLDFAGRTWLLSHGDALCLDDHDYQAFREQVRTSDWQRDFLARPLDERLALARQLRARSEARKAAPGTPLAEVDDHAARLWLQDSGAQALIHGHTHQPGDHALGQGLWRHVLSDWDVHGPRPRLQVLRLTDQGTHRIDLAASASASASASA